MRSSHAPAGVSARFDDPNLIAYGGLAPLVRLAERCGLPGLVDELVRLPPSANGTGAFPASKVMAWSRGWRRARTASTTWTGCGTAP